MDFKEFIDKYFLTTESESTWRANLTKAIEMSLNILRQKPETKICSDVSLPELEKIFATPSFPEESSSFEHVFTDALEKIVAHSVRVSDKRFLGHMTGMTPFAGIIADFLVSTLNQNVVKIETALSGSFVEKQTISWLHRLVYKKSDSFYKNHIHSVTKSLGNMTNGGTLGNLTALTVARNILLPEADQEGLAAALAERGMRRIVILASQRVHYSIKKAASVLGIGAKNVLAVPVNPFTNQISLPDLQRMLNQLEKHKVGILALIGIAGTTETGNIDDLQTLGDIARDHGIWFHVDAAWGGSILTSAKHKALLSGIENADSVVIDGHKLFYVNLNCGAVLFRNETSLDAIRHSANYIIRPGSVDLGRTSLEGSRRFDSFKLWFLMNHLGRQGYETLINNSISLTTRFAELILQSTSFELTSLQQTNIVTYRYVPPEWKEKLIRARTHIENNRTESANNDTEAPVDELASKLRFATEFLNEVNIELQKRQRLLGQTFVSRTTLESVYQGYEVIVLRSVLMNPLTDTNILQEMLKEQEHLGIIIAEQIWAKRLRVAPLCFIDDFGPVQNGYVEIIK